MNEDHLTTDDLARLRAIAEAANVSRDAWHEFRVIFDQPTVLSLLDEVERLRRQLKPSEPSGLMAALCADARRAMTSHRNPQLPQEPPSHG